MTIQNEDFVKLLRRIADAAMKEDALREARIGNVELRLEKAALEARVLQLEMQAKNPPVDSVFVCTSRGPKQKRYYPQSFQLSRGDAELWNQIQADDNPDSSYGVVEIRRGVLVLDLDGDTGSATQQRKEPGA